MPDIHTDCQGLQGCYFSCWVYSLLTHCSCELQVTIFIYFIFQLEMFSALCYGRNTNVQQALRAASRKEGLGCDFPTLLALVLITAILFTHRCQFVAIQLLSSSGFRIIIACRTYWQLCFTDTIAKKSLCSSNSMFEACASLVHRCQPIL